MTTSEDGIFVVLLVSSWDSAIIESLDKIHKKLEKTFKIEVDAKAESKGYKATGTLQINR